MIDMQMFSYKVRQLREEWEDCSEDFGSYREYLASEFSTKRHLWQSAPARTAEDVRDELFTASVAGQFGASKSQIDLIVSLLSAKGDFARTGYTSLTTRQASGLIDQIKKEG